MTRSPVIMKATTRVSHAMTPVCRVIVFIHSMSPDYKVGTAVCQLMSLSGTAMVPVHLRIPGEGSLLDPRACCG